MLLAWEARCVRSVLDLENVHLALLILDDGPDEPQSAARPGTLLFDLYRRYLVKPMAFRLVDMNEVFSGLSTLEGASAMPPGPERCSIADTPRIRAADLDFILHFGSATPSGAVLSAPRHGVWRFRHDDIQKSGGPACFWEIYNADEVTGATLEQLAETAGGEVRLMEGYFKTVGYSYRANIDSVFLGSTGWAAQACNNLRLGNGPGPTGASTRSTRTVRGRPDNAQMLRFAERITRNMFDRVYSQLFQFSAWNVGIVKAPMQAFLDGDERPEIHWLPLPGDGAFAADPFAVWKDEALHLFFERYDYRAGAARGVIAHVKLIDGEPVSEPRTVMELPVHMSYPYLIEYAGDMYCVPETADAGEVRLYKAEKFPYCWRHIATLLKGIAALDATVFEHEGRWWLLCTDHDAGSMLRLFVWHAPDLFGPWEPHAANPVKTDIRSSRPAGPPFRYNGSLYRPAQDCSRRYGGQVSLNRVIALSPTEFEEEQVAIVRPSPDGPCPHGMHTMSATGDVTVVDGRRLIFSRSAFIHVLKREFGAVMTRVRR